MFILAKKPGEGDDARSPCSKTVEIAEIQLREDENDATVNNSEISPKVISRPFSEYRIS